MPDGSNLILGSEANPAWKTNNTSDATTRVERNGIGNVNATALVVENLHGVAIQGVASTGFAGVAGSSPSDAGVSGISTGGQGVRGRSTYSIGVLGISDADTGVMGRGADVGVRGKSDRIGVKGDGAIGVHGEAGNLGVLGDARTGTGVFGTGRVGVVACLRPRRACKVIRAQARE